MFKKLLALMFVEVLVLSEVCAGGCEVALAQPKPTRSYVQAVESPVKASLSLPYPYADVIHKVCEDYPLVPPQLVSSVIWQESGNNPNCVSDKGRSIGLMQINTRWNKERMKKLGVTNLYDPEQNIRMGVDILSEFYSENGDWGLTLMLYNMNHAQARKLYSAGKLSKYAQTVLLNADLG